MVWNFVLHVHIILQTYHCLSPRKMSFSKMDPSCTLGFYCRTREDFDKFVKEIKEVCTKLLFCH